MKKYSRKDMNLRRKKKANKIDRVVKCCESHPENSSSSSSVMDRKPVLNGGAVQVNFASIKRQWLFGDWLTLSAYSLSDIENTPERELIALLVASAHTQLGDMNAARKYSHQALRWGCKPNVVAQILISGVHNTLGRFAGLNQDEGRTQRHFFDAIVSTSVNDQEIVSDTRKVRELSRLGLLPQALTLMCAELDIVRKVEQRPTVQLSRIMVLETQLELLQSELSLAQQRKQLFNVGLNDVLGDSHCDKMEELKDSSVSQLGQDLWVLEKTGYKRNGYFVEFGATDGVMLSNSWLLEKKYGWNGICAEPNPKFYKKLITNRNCVVSDACVGAKTGDEIEFVLADEFGGNVEHVSIDNNAGRRQGYLLNEDNRIKLKTISLNDLLLSMNAPREIDYLSIDTEGSEYDILSSFPFEKWDIRLITVEHNFTPQRELIFNLLTSHGYERTEAQWDDWYIKIA